jgi:hypothetical protein
MPLRPFRHETRAIRIVLRHCNTPQTRARPFGQLRRPNL